MKDDRFDEPLRRMLRGMDPPPVPPREAMWRAIQARRAASAPRRRRFPLAFLLALPWLRWVPAMAGALALGIALGRWTGGAMPAPEPPVATAPAADGALPGDAYTLAALRHMGSAEALLVGFPRDAREGRSEDVARWAGDLLTDTRLLADSPAGEDPEIARLLGDLELVLAQIAALRADPRTDDVRLIEDGIHQNDVLVRLRAATGNGVVTGL